MCKVSTIAMFSSVLSKSREVVLCKHRMLLSPRHIHRANDSIMGYIKMIRLWRVLPPSLPLTAARARVPRSSLGPRPRDTEVWQPSCGGGAASPRSVAVGG
jgi:hypothetical protein